MIEKGIRSGYIFCMNDDSCLHRIGCRRFVGNYDEETQNFIEANAIKTVDESKCIPNLKDIDCENNYGMLDRFRYSTGEEFITEDVKIKK